VVSKSVNVGSTEAHLVSWHVRYPTDCFSYGAYYLDYGVVGAQGSWRIPEDGRLTLPIPGQERYGHPVHLFFSGHRVEGSLVTIDEPNSSCSSEHVTFDLPVRR
jgi:hypothetical protein